MKETLPYTPSADAELIAAGAGTVLDSELFEVSLRGEWTLGASSGPKVLRILDQHAVLGRMLGVALGRVYVRRSAIHLTASAWTQTRRGLMLCACEVVDGELIARHEDGLEVRFPAAGDAPRTGPREATAQFPSQPPRRPGER